jgi:glycosyltransferase involved in cell wall biosynthesis
MKRTLIVTNSMTGGGAERSMNLLANSLAKNGWDVLLVPVNLSDEDGVQIASPVSFLGRGLNGGIVSTFLAGLRLNSLVLSWKPDVVILNCALPEFLGSLIFKKLKIIIVEHSPRPWEKREFMGKIVRKLLTIRGSSWVSVSKVLPIWSCKVEFEYIPNFVHFNTTPDLSPNFSFPNKGISRLVFIGRLSREKRPEWVLEVARNVGLPTLFIGEGGMRSFLESKALELGVDCSFMGQATHPWAKVRDDDLILISSEYEGDCLVVLECLINGKNFILSDIPELRRFGFSSEIYCTNPTEMSVKIKDGIQSSYRCDVDPDLRKSIILERDPELLTEIWSNFLESC